MSTESTSVVIEKANELADQLLPKVADALESVAAKIGPDPAKDNATVIVAAEAGEGVETGGRRRWPWVLAGLAVAAGAGMAAKMLRDRKSRAEEVEWPTYEPPGSDAGSGTVDSAVAEAKKSVAEAAEQAKETGRSAAAKTRQAADKAADSVTDITDKVADAATDATSG